MLINVRDIYNFFFFSLSFTVVADSVASASTNTKTKVDQSTASSWWRPAVSGGVPSAAAAAAAAQNVFSATHGVVQTHPSLSSASLRGSSSSPILGAAGRALGGGGVGSTTRPLGNGKLPFRHLDYSSSATAELRRNPSLSAPDECARACREGEPPRICYYHFTLEYYTVLGA